MLFAFLSSNEPSSETTLKSNRIYEFKIYNLPGDCIRL